MQSLCPTSCSNQRLAHGLLCKELEVHGVVLPVHVQDAAFGRWQDALGRVALHAVVVGVDVLAQSIPPTATATGGNRDSPLIQLCKWEWYRSEEQQTDISFPFKKRTRTLRKNRENDNNNNNNNNKRKPCGGHTPWGEGWPDDHFHSTQLRVVGQLIRRPRVLHMPVRSSGEGLLLCLEQLFQLVQDGP